MSQFLVVYGRESLLLLVLLLLLLFPLLEGGRGVEVTISSLMIESIFSFTVIFCPLSSLSSYGGGKRSRSDHLLFYSPLIVENNFAFAFCC
jgi:hypothetical protein